MFIVLAILGLLTAVAVVPIDTRPLASTPRPILAFEDASARFDSLRQAEGEIAMPDGRSLLFSHQRRTPRVVVLLHGLTNSPRQFRELGQLFHDRGDNVLVPRLPAHGLLGADVANLRTLTAEQYRDYADRAVDIAVGLGDSVIVVGLSAGGDVALWIAQHRSDVARVVVIAPAISLARIPGVLDAPAMNVLMRMPNLTLRQTPDTSRPHAYFGVSTRALGETLRFGASVMERAEHAPPLVRDLTLVVNASDRTVDESPVRRLASLWPRRDGVGPTEYRFDASLRLPHDVIDVHQRCGMPEVVYGVVIALVEKRTPDATLDVMGLCRD